MRVTKRMTEIQNLKRGDRISALLQSYRVERIHTYNLAETLFEVTLIPESMPGMRLFGVYRSDELMPVITENVGAN